VTRGGGSLEDLWAFNEEPVARAIFDSAVPVVSAVGHEIDFTISDFVADIRAATPSAAAEIITEGVFASAEFIAQAGGRMRQLARGQLEEKRDALDQAAQRLARVHPRRMLNERLQRLDDLQTSLGRRLRQGLRDHAVAVRNLSDRLGRLRPAVLLHQRREVLLQAALRLREMARHRLRDRQQRLEQVQTRLRLLGPEQVLARGYSITMDAATGAVVRDAARVQPGQRLKTRLQKGTVTVRAEPPATTDQG
jgi:exodeoxyribonuclease VII large subunit